MNPRRLDLLEKIADISRHIKFLRIHYPVILRNDLVYSQLHAAVEKLEEIEEGNK